MYACMMYVCIYVCTLFGAPGGIDVSQVGYACVALEHFLTSGVCLARPGLWQ